MSDSKLEVRSRERPNLVVHVAGDGPPVILLHGLTSSHLEWVGLRSALMQRYTCLAWDARGHGASEVGTAPLSIGELADDLAAMVTALSPRKPLVVGHSLGAVTILEFLRRYGGNVLAGAVLVDQSPRMLTGPDWDLGVYGGFTSADNLAFEWQMRRDAADAYLRFLACGFNARARAEYDAGTAAVQRIRSHLHTMPGAPWLSLWKSFVHKDYRDDLARASLPVLAVLGGESNLYDAARLARWFAEFVPHAVTQRYEGADHAPHLAMPARFARDVAVFAARCMPGSAPRQRLRPAPADVVATPRSVAQTRPERRVAGATS